MIIKTEKISSAFWAAKPIEIQSGLNKQKNVHIIAGSSALQQLDLPPAERLRFFAASYCFQEEHNATYIVSVDVLKLV